MALNKDDIIERQKVLVEDAQKVQARIGEMEKELANAKNLLQALNGALQQCAEFAQKIDNEDSDVGNGEDTD